jgi:hypothetical protein
MTESLCEIDFTVLSNIPELGGRCSVASKDLNVGDLVLRGLSPTSVIKLSLSFNIF